MEQREAHAAAEAALAAGFGQLKSACGGHVQENLKRGQDRCDGMHLSSGVPGYERLDERVGSLQQ